MWCICGVCIYVSYMWCMYIHVHVYTYTTYMYVYTCTFKFSSTVCTFNQFSFMSIKYYMYLCVPELFLFCMFVTCF